MTSAEDSGFVTRVLNEAQCLRTLGGRDRLVLWRRPAVLSTRLSSTLTSQEQPSPSLTEGFCASPGDRLWFEVPRVPPSPAHTPVSMTTQHQGPRPRAHGGFASATGTGAERRSLTVFPKSRD
uniref:Uncharacterized protein n=1 Tax=Knipowitschia caucasica TaxID=637954 RepID=A0AAV2L463_KNICA